MPVSLVMPAKPVVWLLHMHIHTYSDHLSGSSIRKLKWGDETEWFSVPALSLCLWGPPADPQNKCGLWTGATWMKAHYSLNNITAKLKEPWKRSTAGVLVPPPENADTPILRDSTSGLTAWLAYGTTQLDQWAISYSFISYEFQSFIPKNRFSL